VAGKYPFITWGAVDIKNKRMDIELGPTKIFFDSTFKIKNFY
jgi:hypothetical protein